MIFYSKGEDRGNRIATTLIVDSFPDYQNSRLYSQNECWIIQPQQPGICVYFRSI